MKEKNDIAKIKAEGGELSFTEENVLNLTNQYDVVVMVHSCYDIDFERFFHSMFNSGVKIIYNCFNWNNSILTQTFTNLLVQDIECFRHKKKTDDEYSQYTISHWDDIENVDISFRHNKSPGEYYTHNYKNYLKWALSSNVNYKFKGVGINENEISAQYQRNVLFSGGDNVVIKYTLNIRSEGSPIIEDSKCDLMDSSVNEVNSMTLMIPMYTWTILGIQTITNYAFVTIPETQIEVIQKVGHVDTFHNTTGKSNTLISILWTFYANAVKMFHTFVESEHFINHIENADLLRICEKKRFINIAEFGILPRIFIFFKNMALPINEIYYSIPKRQSNLNSFKVSIEDEKSSIPKNITGMIRFSEICAKRSSILPKSAHSFLDNKFCKVCLPPHYKYENKCLIKILNFNNKYCINSNEFDDIKTAQLCWATLPFIYVKDNYVYRSPFLLSTTNYSHILLITDTMINGEKGFRVEKVKHVDVEKYVNSNVKTNTSNLIDIDVIHYIRTIERFKIGTIYIKNCVLESLKLKHDKEKRSVIHSKDLALLSELFNFDVYHNNIRYMGIRVVDWTQNNINRYEEFKRLFIMNDIMSIEEFDEFEQNNVGINYFNKNIIRMNLQNEDDQRDNCLLVFKNNVVRAKINSSLKVFKMESIDNFTLSLHGY